HPRGAPGAGVGLPTLRGHPPRQRARTALTRQDREGSGEPGSGAHRQRRRIQGRSAVVMSDRGIAAETNISDPRELHADTGFHPDTGAGSGRAKSLPFGLSSGNRMDTIRGVFSSPVEYITSLWRRSLQFRVVTTTLGLSLAVILAVAFMLQTQMAEQLRTNKEDS